MKLPLRDKATVSREKILDYLLSPTHPHGRQKAAFFAAYGFRREDWQDLAEALVRHAQQQDAAGSEETSFGTRYTVEGILQTPDGRNPQVRTIWFIDAEEGPPRLVTAYPLRRSRS